MGDLGWGDTASDLGGSRCFRICGPTQDDQEVLQVDNCREGNSGDKA